MNTNFKFYLLTFAICILLLITILAPYIVPFDPYEQNLANTLQAPNAIHLLGTDKYGRDIFSRILIGAQTTIFSSLFLVIISSIFGSLIGVICGYFGKNLDNLLMRITDIFLAFPGIIFAIALVGILGGTGTSKTTLVQLIPRLYDTTEGRVLVGGVDVQDYDMEVLREQVAMVLQKNVLFSGSIKENLRWGNAEATDEEMVRVCKLAQADPFIQEFPDKYDTHIEQGGSNVSGGQKQRLCIARALLKKPKILILDDSTSAVDTKTDALIRKAFREEIPETTKFIIAQRISSIEDADLILVMDGGRIYASGTHQELLDTCDIYREIYQSQTKGGNEDA